MDKSFKVQAVDLLIDEAAKVGRNPMWGQEDIDQGHYVVNTVARLIEQQDALRREVSDAAKYVADSETHPSIKSALSRFILPEPVDPLLGVVEEAIAGTAEKGALQLREALAKRGLSIVPTPATVDGEGAKP